MKTFVMHLKYLSTSYFISRFLTTVFLVVLLGSNAEESDECKGENHAHGAEVATSRIEESVYPVMDLFGIWTYDPNGPHADFKLTSESYYVVDYDGNGNMPYLIRRDSIIVYYERITMRGKITKARNDTMIISWDHQDSVVYTRWKN